MTAVDPHLAVEPPVGQTELEIYTGIAPEIIEAYRIGWRVGVHSTIGTDTVIHDPQEDPHCFIVDVLSYGELTAEQKSKVMTPLKEQMKKLPIWKVVKLEHFRHKKCN